MIKEYSNILVIAFIQYTLIIYLLLNNLSKTYFIGLFKLILPLKTKHLYIPVYLNVYSHTIFSNFSFRLSVGIVFGDKMNAIQEVKDEAIRKVAQTLRSSGLASSETEAVRMAMMMSKTSQRVTQNFDMKRQGATMGAHFHQEEEKKEEDYPVITNAFGSSRKITESRVQAPFSVQEKPSKIEEKEEFILGDVQEESTAQKKDPFMVSDNEFEEVISQEVVGTKATPVARQEVQIHRAFGQSNAPRLHEQESQAPVHEKPSTPMQRPIDSTQAPLSAQSSAQMAFASLLGSAQKTQVHHQEARPAAAQEVVHSFSEAQVVQPVQKQAPFQQPASLQNRVAINHAPDSRANLMKEANVDLSRMFNVNK